MTYAYIPDARTLNVKQGTGRLIGIVVNETAAGTITVYNETTAVATAKIATLKASIAEGSYNFFGVPFTTGLTIVTAAASNITVIYE